MSQLTAIRLLDADEPAGPLLEAVRDLAEGQLNKSTYQVEPDSFRQVPNAPFAYWVSENIRGLFTELPPFEGDGRTAKVGLQTGDDFRFVRTAWETHCNDSSQIWFLFAKGGSHSPFYSDIHLNVNWRDNGRDVFEFNGSVVRNSDFYFRTGVTWPIKNRSTFKPWPLPKGCIFANVGSSAFIEKQKEEMWGLMSSYIFTFLLRLMAGWNFEVGLVQKNVGLGKLATYAWSTKRSTDTANQTSHAFYAPALSPGQFDSRNKKTTTA